MVRTVLLAAGAALLTVAASATAAPRVTWTPAAGAVPAHVVDATLDGAGVAVLSRGGGGLLVHRVAGGRIAGIGSIPATRPQTAGPSAARILRAEDGTLVVVWFGRGTGIHSATRPPGPGRRFGPPTLLSRWPEGIGASAGLAVAQAVDGRILAVWWGGPAGGTLGIQAAERGRDGVWSPPADIAAGTFPQGHPPPALDAEATPDGGWVAAWGGASRELIVARHPDATGPWQAPFVAGPPGSSPGQVAIDGAGDLVAAWEAAPPDPSGIGRERCLRVAHAPAGATTTLIQDLACLPIGVALATPPLLLPTSLSGALIVWDSPTDLSALTWGRASGAAGWRGPTLAIAPPRGILPGAVPLSAGRTLVVGGRFAPGLLRLVFVRPDGTVIRREDGPATPGRLGGHEAGFTPATTPVPNPGLQGVLTWLTASGTRMRVLTVVG